MNMLRSQSHVFWFWHMVIWVYLCCICVRLRSPKNVYSFFRRNYWMCRVCVHAKDQPKTPSWPDTLEDTFDFFHVLWQFAHRYSYIKFLFSGFQAAWPHLFSNSTHSKTVWTCHTAFMWATLEHFRTYLDETSRKCDVKWKRMACPRRNFCIHYHFSPENCNHNFGVINIAIAIIIYKLLPKVVGVDMSFLPTVLGNDRFVINSSDSWRQERQQQQHWRQSTTISRTMYCACHSASCSYVAKCWHWYSWGVFEDLLKQQLLCSGQCIQAIVESKKHLDTCAGPWALHVTICLDHSSSFFFGGLTAGFFGTGIVESDFSLITSCSKRITIIISLLISPLRRSHTSANRNMNCYEKVLIDN